MSHPVRFFVRSLLGLALASGLAQAGCASLGDASALGSGHCFGLQCPDSGVGAGGDGTISKPPEAGTDAEGGSQTSDLCATGCLPDDPMACTGAGASPGEAGPGDAAFTADAMNAPDAGASADAAVGFADASSGQGDAAPDGGTGAPAPGYACHLTRQSGSAAAVCEPAGHGREHAPCVDSSDCAAGYGCVLDGAAGECRHFCCAGNSACQCDPDAGADCDPGLAGTFCADRPLKADIPNGDPTQTAQLAPVCVPADNCNLAEPYPCQAANAADCTCPEPGTACMVVGDGLTSCIAPPGTGQAGDPCPCAWGHVCSQATGKCLKICSLTTNDPGCGGGKCQASKQMPDYFGVCVPSAVPDGGY